MALRNRLRSLARTAITRLEDRYRGIRRTEATAQAPAPVAEEPPVAPVKKPVNWELRSQAELVAHIVDHYHAGLRRDLPLLIDAARSVEREHRDHADRPTGLADLLEEFSNELESHMAKEERVLFPTLRTGQRGGQVDMPIRMMEREHEGHDEMLARIRQVTRDLTAPASAPAAWSKLYVDLSALESELREHIYLENNVLFARALGGEY
jgi:regulator of cell morphogenesis and NO signaling